MEYEKVRLSAKKVAGVLIRTNNHDAGMGEKIGGAWKQFYASLYPLLPAVPDAKAIGLYTNYAGDADSDYDMLACCEVRSDASLPVGSASAEIPAGIYARFIVRGDVQKDVAAFWKRLWKMDLNRAYTADFEEYQNNGDMTNCEIHIYIALKE
ncbi:GyrI-like domain-containing protein [Brucepastera parasyntrophica]|uniref:GyrI-like domain-containing protein n=1 Tax=Brucepastera parasyntrophica TaxID=2880008 RepID=UPI00210A1497|nr:GyrI-like domain-containing protein [Brucepastera parasyntrophica]ULQ58892.1 GyrI-like domain-containing protein [Brucepastera parasyntrophica]